MYPILVFPPYWKFDLLKTVGPVQSNGKLFVSRTISGTNWHHGNLNPIFFHGICSAAGASQEIENFVIKQD